MQVLFVFIYWIAALFSGHTSLPGVTSSDSLPAKPTAILPVKLLAFNAKTDGTVNILEWHTTSEVNTREFIIETSVDGKDFRLSIWVTPKGAPNTPTYYRYTDTTASAQTYYRLRMVDADGKEQVSRTIPVKKQTVARS